MFSFSFLDRFGRPWKYAIIVFFAGIIGMFLSVLILGETAGFWWLTPIASGVGGYIGGTIREKRERS